MTSAITALCVCERETERERKTDRQREFAYIWESKGRKSKASGVVREDVI